MSDTFTFKLHISGPTIDQYAKEVQDKLPAVCKKHIFNIAANAAKDAPVDTGNLRNTLADGVEELDPLHWTESDATDYGIHQELGTNSIQAKHFLGNASEKEADPFFDDVKEALGK